jgi:hypothetical protein
VDSCPFCGGKLKKVVIEVEKIGQLDVNWLIVEDSRQVGVAGIKSLPSYFMKIWSEIKLVDSRVNVILLDSKKKAVELEKSLYERYGLTYEERVTSERSRYSIFSPNAESPYFLILNQHSLNERSAIFLTILNIRFCEKWTPFRRAADKKQREIIDSVAQSLFVYNKKMGFPYVSADEGMRTFILNLVSNLQQTYVECKVIQELANEKIYVSSLADYLQYKLETSFEGMDFSARFIIYEVLQNLEKIMLDNFLIEATSENISLFQFVVNCFNENFEAFKIKYAELPDLIKATEYVNSNLRNFFLSTYEEFVDTASSVLMTAMSKIEAEYVSLAEAVDLLRLSDYYLKGLENNVLVEVPNLGTIHQYIKLLKKVFAREGIYPEVRILAGYALEHTFMSWLMISGNISLFEDYAKYTKELALLIEQNLPQILKKNSSFGDFQGSPLRYEDAALKLLTLSKIARSFGDKDIEKESLELASQMADKYGLSSVKFASYWTKFVETQNFTYLEKIHDLMRNADKEEMSRFDFLAVPLDLLIESMLHKEKIDQNIDSAENILLESSPIGATLQTYAKTGLNTTERFYHIFEMIRELLKYQGKLESIKKAYNEALILNEILEQTDPLQILSLKTRILYCLLSNDINSVNLLCQKLAKYEDPEKCISQFLDYSSKWVKIVSSNEERKYMHRNEFQYEGKDCWISILQSFVLQAMENDLGSNIAGSSAVVFVEGITDLLVLKEFIIKLEKQEKTYFIDLEGFSNFGYYVESRVVKEMRIPSYLIFDGDTSEEKRRKIINLVSISANRTYTLQKRSIEDYLLNAKAIVRAYPEMRLSEKAIEAFFSETDRKKNKKSVLQLLFQRFKIGSYDKDNAKKIASNFEVEEISFELKTLLSNIVNLRNV